MLAIKKRPMRSERCEFLWEKPCSAAQNLKVKIGTFQCMYGRS